MTRPETPFEAASYDLNKFRERRMAERRAVQRDTADRRIAPNGQDAGNRQQPDETRSGSASQNQGNST